MDWERPDPHNIREIPILDEFYFNNSVFKNNHSSSRRKKIQNRQMLRDEYTTQKSISHNNKNTNGNSWLINVKNKHKKRLILNYTQTELNIDNSSDVLNTEKQYDSSILSACASMINHVTQNLSKRCKVLNSTYLYNIKNHRLLLVKELSDIFSEYIAIPHGLDNDFDDTDSFTIILNNNLTDLITDEKTVEGLLGKAYSDNEYTVFYDITSNNKLYFLLNMTENNMSYNNIKNTEFVHETIHETLESMLQKLSINETPQCHPEYYRVCPTLDSIRAFLFEGHCLVAGIDCFNNINDKTCSENGVILSPAIDKDAGKIIGGHCVLLVGFNDEKKMLKFKNSLGNDWGDFGYGYIPYNHVLMGYVADVWVVFAKGIC